MLAVSGSDVVGDIISVETVRGEQASSSIAMG